MANYFVTGIGTNVGKTIVSTVLVEALQSDYWKPIQSGTIEGKDSDTIKELISNSKTIIHPETYLLKEPLSPHFAAHLEGVEIDINSLELPQTNNQLIIEGAGGLLVPINQSHYVIDIAKKFNCEIILVISNYLGCINHSLLSIDYLVRNNFKIKALVFNGEFEEQVKNVIINYVSHLNIVEINQLPLNKESVKKVAAGINVTLFNT